MTYDNLPVYKVSYDLLLQLFRFCRNMQRDYRYTLGESIKNELVSLMLNIHRPQLRLAHRQPDLSTLQQCLSARLGLFCKKRNGNGILRQICR